MRLLSVKTLSFRDFTCETIPEYAILSHRWGEDELSFQDMCRAIHSKTRPGVGKFGKKQGFCKIYDFSRQAFQDGYEFIWVDTCCIDKSSSAELQEAINSMYDWYKNSAACYVYLSDVCIPEDYVGHVSACLLEAAFVKSFKASEWFTCGWTLQELLALKKVVFYDQAWRTCGTACYLNKLIREATGIDVQSLTKGDMHGQDEGWWPSRIGRRMAWAAKRQTTRVEDQAYSLLGLFNVNMPMIYGERDRAFQRLQEEIIKADEDASILIWSCMDRDTGFTPNGLAKSPAHFHLYPMLMNERGRDCSFVSFNPTITPRGLQATLNIKRDPNDQTLGYAVLMEGKRRSSRRSKLLVVPIMFTSLNFSRSKVKNECVRFSDPVWAPSSFAEQAKSTPLCFIRHIQAADVNNNSDGFSLSPVVWEAYIPIFTYPIQTQSGRQHFPAVCGMFSLSSRKRKNYTFILELANRAQRMERKVVIVDYEVERRKISKNLSVTVIKLQ